MKVNTIITSILLMIGTVSLQAQNQFQNTLTLEPDYPSPEATLSDISWIQGHWKGEALGGITEEIWSPPLGGSMMCAFKLVVNGEIQFYEFVTIIERENSLILRLKHFHPDLKGWEEKDETIDFSLVKVAKNWVYFDGFTFEKVSEDEINTFVILGNGDSKEEVRFNYKRVSE